MSTTRNRNPMCADRPQWVRTVCGAVLPSSGLARPISQACLNPSAPYGPSWAGGRWTAQAGVADSDCASSRHERAADPPYYCSPTPLGGDEAERQEI